MNVGYGYTYQDQVVRDLLWAVRSPQLLRPARQAFKALLSPAELADWYGRLATVLKEKGMNGSGGDWPDSGSFRRLGHYFEALVAAAIRWTPGMELIAQNLSLHAKDRTLGELDFLVRRKETGRLEHWESAVKFYLLHGNGARTDAWIGPNPKDRLDLKMHKLAGHQLVITQRQAVKNLLDEWPTEVRLLFKGYLFYPLAVRRPLLPDSVNANHLHGWWCYVGERESLIQKETDCWKVLPRMQWLSRAESASAGHLMSNTQFLERLEATEKGERPVLVARLRQQEDRWLETDRGFVVPSEWPGMS